MTRLFGSHAQDACVVAGIGIWNLMTTESVPEFICVHPKMIVEHRDTRRRDSSKLKVHTGNK